MKFPIYQVDAFASRQFSGNPAAVIVLNEELSDDLMQSIAAETGQPATAFVQPLKVDWRIRWFTHARELPLCGHGTLAGAWVVLNILQPDRAGIIFGTKHCGELPIKRFGNGLSMSLPAEPAQPVRATEALNLAFGGQAQVILANAANHLAVLENAQAVVDFQPNLEAIAAAGRTGLIITAAGHDGFDCVSRYFAPAKGVPEDPVTGSAHCAIIPYWAERLNQPKVRAYQASSRGGELDCTMHGDRVEFRGQCVPFSQGFIDILV